MLANFSNLITFSRGSNATVTDASGRLTYAANNLLTNSETFENAAWASGVTTAVTANTAMSPVGTQTADTATINSTTTMVRQIGTSIVTIGASYILSVWVKASASSPAANTRLTVNNTASWTGAASTKVALTSQWQRISLPWTANGTGFYFMIGAIDATGANDTTCHGNVDLWGAQLEAVTYQTTPSPYVSTSVANLLGFSEDFANAAWTKDNVAIVPGLAQNPINNLWNAQKLMENTANSNHRAFQSFTTVSGVPYTFSVYAKAAERTRLELTSATGVVFDSIFDLSTGTVAATLSGAAAITSIGNGWYRCSVSGTAATSTSTNMQVRLVQTGTTNSYTGDGNSGVYIYGAQLSNSGSLDPYVPTPGAAPSSTAYYGPRFDYDPVTLAAKGILIEEQRTNLLTYSEQFDNAAWTKDGATITANSALAPDGSTTADTITGTSGNFRAYQLVTVANGTAYTMSAFVKQGTSPTIAVNFINVSGGPTFTFATATWSSVAGWTTSVQNVGNGWYRIAATYTSNTTFAGPGWIVSGATTAFIWGAQLEAGAFATSYIPTVASQVTRTADVASITGSLFSQWFNQDQGTLVAQVYRGDASGTTRGVWSARDVTGTTSMDYRVYAGQCLVQISGATQADLYPGAGSANTVVKNAFTYRVNDFAAATNNGVVQTDTSGAVPIVSQLNIGALSAVTGQVLCGHIQTIEYIPNAVSASQLQSATS